MHPAADGHSEAYASALAEIGACAGLLHLEILLEPAEYLKLEQVRARDLTMASVPWQH